MAASPEALFLSAVLRTQDHGALTKHGLTEEMFPAHPDEWQWVSKYHARYQKLPSKQAFKEKFPDFVVYQVEEVDHYADEVREAYARSAVTDLLDRSVDLMMQGHLDKAMEGLGTDLLRIQATVQDQVGDYDLAAHWESTYQAAMDRIERVRQHGRAGIPFGFPTLDLNTGGAQPGWYVIVGGRLSAGKTWTMVRMAAAASLAGYTSLYYSLEQPTDQIAVRTHTLFSAHWNDETFRHLDLLRGTGFDLTKYKTFLSGIEDNLDGRLVINDSRRGRVAPMTVAAGIEREEPDIVFIDYLTLMKQNGDGGWLSVAELSAALQQLAHRYEVPIVVGSQLNRTAIGDDEPDPGTIGRADAVGQDADLVISVAKKSKRVRKLNLAKNRHGPDGMAFFVKWDPNNGVIEEVSGDEASDLIEDDKLED